MSTILCVLAGARLLLGAGPVLIELTLQLVSEVGGPDNCESIESLDIADNTNNNGGVREENGEKSVLVMLLRGFILYRFHGGVLLGRVDMAGC
ncbi:hypothetical protein BD310DRAFT_934622 [Dichomitus squalens]|uniref:Secreted protein n=1 Tax=Dichomitus squalens TaxID=114155 RepID=A0A4Q9PLC9_9APHY|nr:hypothetical protein BD310DRAFT_934622 [Dichomitus squalens]